MNEIDTLKRAKMYIDQMANGIHPITGEIIPETDTLNNIRISRCLFYVSGVLRDVIEDKTALTTKTNKKVPFYMTDEETRSFKVQNHETYISSFAADINKHINDESRKKLQYSNIMRWLVENGYMVEKLLEGNRKNRYPTEKGADIGIRAETRISQKGEEYNAILLDVKAQQFVLDNIKAITGTNR